VYMSFAFMLSVLTRNTAAAVGISVAGYFGSGIVQGFLAFLPNYEFLKFLPFSNLTLQSRFFPFSNLMQSLSYGGFSMGGTFTYPSLTFSLVYLLVILFCMNYTAMDSFNRRDIK
jgi:ABC-2 type transport system permease protein